MEMKKLKLPIFYLSICFALFLAIPGVMASEQITQLYSSNGFTYSSHAFNGFKYTTPSFTGFTYNKSAFKLPYASSILVPFTGTYKPYIPGSTGPFTGTDIPYKPGSFDPFTWTNTPYVPGSVGPFTDETSGTISLSVFG